MARVLPENVSGPETPADVTAPVPLPVRMPPKVVEPVPPLATASVPKIDAALKVEVAETTPCALVCKKPDGDPEMVRLVVEAVEKKPVPVTVRPVVVAPPPRVVRPDTPSAPEK